MSNKTFYEVYRKAEQELRDECDELVRKGEMSQEDADFRFWMVRAYMEGVDCMKKKYILKVTRTGKEWKSFTSGADFLDDNKKYRLEWELNSLWDCVRGWWGIVRKHHHTLTLD